MTTTYHVNGIKFDRLSPQQNAALWAMYKMNEQCSMAQIGRFMLCAKGTAIAHVKRLQQKGFIYKIRGFFPGEPLRFKIEPWVKGEIRKAINRSYKN